MEIGIGKIMEIGVGIIMEEVSMEIGIVMGIEIEIILEIETEIIEITLEIETGIIIEKETGITMEIGIIMTIETILAIRDSLMRFSLIKGVGIPRSDQMVEVGLEEEGEEDIGITEETIEETLEARIILIIKVVANPTEKMQVMKGNTVVAEMAKITNVRTVVEGMRRVSLEDRERAECQGMNLIHHSKSRLGIGVM